MYRKQSKRLFLIILLFFNLSFSQNMKKADSLLHILETRSLSKKEQAKTLRLIAFFHTDLNAALLSAKQSLEIATEIGDPIFQAEALEEISHLERRLGNNSQSFDASLEALQIYELEGLKERQAASYNQIASNYMVDKDYHLAIDYLKKATVIYTNSNELINQASTILNLGEAYRLEGHLDSAVTSFQETLKLNDLIKNDLIEGYSLGNLGMVYSAQNNLASAKENLDKAIIILAKLGDSYSTSIYLAELGEVYAKETAWTLAEEKYQEALAMAKQAGLKEQIRDFSAMLSGFYEKQQQYSQALQYQKLFQIYQDSLVNKENIQKIEQLKSGYEIDKRESEIGLLNRINSNQRYAVVLLITGILLVLFFVYLLYSGNKKIKKVNSILSHQKDMITKREQEKALLLRELNHRVKNNLQMISSLLNLQSNELTGLAAKDAIVSGKYRVEALSLVHRKLYQEGVDTRIFIKEYIEELVLGLFHGYGAKFKPEFNIDNISIHIDMAIPLALIINELITNALKYAYNDINHPILKIIIAQKTKGHLRIQVLDNGVGFETIEGEKSNSFGIKLIRSLVEQLEGTIKKTTSNGTHWELNVNVA